MGGSYLDDTKLEIKRELVVSIASGDLMLEKGSPQSTIPKSITISGVGDPSEALKVAKRADLVF
jgi:hypothetical protein